MRNALSIVTLTWNSEKYIINMLDSLIKKLEFQEFSYEIIIIDNGSNDQTIKMIECYENNRFIKLIKLDSNKGTTYSRNLGLKKCSYENILIVDSDMDFSDTDFIELIQGFDNIDSKNIGIIQPQLVHPTGEVQSSILKFPTIANKLKRFMGNSISPYDLTKIQKVDYAISAAWLIKKGLFKKVGYLDEKIFYAPEDAEFCKRLSINNFETWYYPKVQIVHHYQRITNKKKFSKMWFIHLKGLIYYWLKY